MDTGNLTSHISVCICTYRRPQLLTRLLRDVGRQESGGRFKVSVVVVDNDQKRTAEPVVAAFAATRALPVKYVVEPRQNIAMARNAALANADGEWVAFIDDDEYPDLNWLNALLTTCDTAGADGVLGPVRPYFVQPPPRWVTTGGFFERPTHATGWRVSLSEARTGNVLFRKKMLAGLSNPFQPEFGVGGEDVDFFRRMMRRGAVFIWCNEAVVHEVVPPERCNRRYLVRRALLRGRIALIHPTGRLRSISRSLIAAPLYAIALPFCFVAGERYGLKLLIRLCDHAGKLMAVVGINPVSTRDS